MNDEGQAEPVRNQRELQREATAARLVASAQDCFARQTYAATTVDDIARAAGVTRATFYLHFGSKADVIVELSRRMKEQSRTLDDQLWQAVRNGDRKSIRQWLATAFTFWDDIRPVAVAIEEAASLEPTVRELRTGEFEDHVRIIANALDESTGVSRPSTRTRAILAYSQFQSLFYRWSRVGWEVDREEVLDVVTEMWVAALTHLPAAVG